MTQRRDVLKLALATAAAGSLPRSAWTQPRMETNPFALGVASGCPTHDSVVLWTRVMGNLPDTPITVRWEVASDEAFTRIVRRGEQEAPPELAHSVHAEVGGLEPDRWYFYRFMVRQAVSPTGRTRTTPAPDAAASRLRLAYASCQRWEHGYFSAYQHMVKEDLDFVFFLGDYIYEYAGAKDAVRMPSGGAVLSLDDYRARYALHRGEPELQAMHAACPWMLAWDDHEVQNDYAGLVAGDGVAALNFAKRRAAAYQAYYEHMPLRASMLTRAIAGLRDGAETRIYTQQRFGTLANIVMLDDRQYRADHACNPGGKLGSATIDPSTCAIWDDPKRTMLGEAQEQWLDGVFAQRGATWTILGQQTLFAERNFKTSGEGRQLWNDGWDGYTGARRKLTESLLRNQAPNPVFLGGDVHENWVGHVKLDYAKADSATAGVEFCGTSITSRAFDYDAAPVLAKNPHFVFADNKRKGYGVVEFTPKQLTTTLRVVDDVTKRDTRIETLASFSVQAGRPRIERL